MASGIYALPVICIVTNISMSQNTGKQTNMNREAELSEVNVPMHALQITMDNFVTDNKKQMESFVTDNQKLIEELKSAFNTKFNSVSEMEKNLEDVKNRVSFVMDNQKQIEELISAFNTKFDSVPEMERNLEDVKDKVEPKQDICSQGTQKESSTYTFHYTLKSWKDADLSCKADCRHLVSFETVAEHKRVRSMIPKKCSALGFWTSALDLGDDNWIWQNTSKKVHDDLWDIYEPFGDGDCAHMTQWRPGYLLDDFRCSTKYCFICESL